MLILGSYGTIEFSIVHDEQNRLLVVSIIKAKVKRYLEQKSYGIKKSFYLQKIKGMDINGLSDSYCKVTIVPAMGRVSLKFL